MNKKKLIVSLSLLFLFSGQINALSTMQHVKNFFPKVGAIFYGLFLGKEMIDRKNWQEKQEAEKMYWVKHCRGKLAPADIISLVDDMKQRLDLPDKVDVYCAQKISYDWDNEHEQKRTINACAGPFGIMLAQRIIDSLCSGRYEDEIYGRLTILHELAHVKFNHYYDERRGKQEGDQECEFEADCLAYYQLQCFECCRTMMNCNRAHKNIDLGYLDKKACRTVAAILEEENCLCVYHESMLEARSICATVQEENERCLNPKALLIVDGFFAEKSYTDG